MHVWRVGGDRPFMTRKPKKKPPRSKLEAALRDATPHVRRQRTGRHEQDRLDAEEWLAKYDDVVKSVREN